MASGKGVNEVCGLRKNNANCPSLIHIITFIKIVLPFKKVQKQTNVLMTAEHKTH